MARDTATVTAKIGPGGSVSSLALTNVKQILFDREHEVFTVYHGDPVKSTVFAYGDIATITASVSGGSTAFTVST